MDYSSVMHTNKKGVGEGAAMAATLNIQNKVHLWKKLCGQCRGFQNYGK